MQATQWLKLPLFLDETELSALFEALEAPFIVSLSGVFPQGKKVLTAEEYLSLYTHYLEEALSERECRPDKLLVSAWSRSLDAIEERVVPNGFLVRPKRPVLQVQPYWLNYSERDGKFHEMALSRDSLPWGLLFSFPQLFQEPDSLEIVKVKEPEFINVGLFKALQRFSRSYTVPTPFETPLGRVNHPARIGKRLLKRASNMAKLLEKGLALCSD